MALAICHLCFYYFFYYYHLTIISPSSTRSTSHCSCSFVLDFCSWIHGARYLAAVDVIDGSEALPRAMLRCTSVILCHWPFVLLAKMDVWKNKHNNDKHQLYNSTTKRASGCLQCYNNAHDTAWPQPMWQRREEEEFTCLTLRHLFVSLL